MTRHPFKRGEALNWKTILIGAAIALTLGTVAEAAHVTRVWHVDRHDPDSTLCRESEAGRTIITTGSASAAQFDDPTPAEWARAGCEASRPHMISHAEMVRRFNEQTAGFLAYDAYLHPHPAQADAPTPVPQQ